MDPSSAAHALARASATLIEPHDVSGTLAALLQSCKQTLEVDAAGVLIQVDGHLDLLSASSHDACELETLQAQLEQGPCVDAHDTGVAIMASGRDKLLDRWPAFGKTMLDAGFASAHASPLRWHRTTIGAMGLFRRSDRSFTDDEDTFAQAFADIATALIVSTKELAADELTQRLHDALRSRIVVEQAKGVLAEQQDLSMADAYDLLLHSATDRRTPLGDWAAQIVQAAGHTRI